MDANVAAGLSYIWIIGLIFFFVEKTNRFVKFHAAQAILLDIVAVVLYIVESIVTTALGVGAATTANSATATAATTGGSLLAACIFGLLGLGLFGLWLWGRISA